MTDDKIVKFPVTSTDAVETFADLLAEAKLHLRENYGTNSAALDAVERLPGSLPKEAQVARAADALVTAYIHDSWERVLYEARRLTIDCKSNDFAILVLHEIERRASEDNSSSQ